MNDKEDDMTILTLITMARAIKKAYALDCLGRFKDVCFDNKVVFEEDIPIFINRIFSKVWEEK